MHVSIDSLSVCILLFRLQTTVFPQPGSLLYLYISITYENKTNKTNKTNKIIKTNKTNKTII